MAQKNNSQSKGTTTKDVKYYSNKFWRLFLYTLGGVFLFFLFASWGLFGAMPSFEDLENPEQVP